MSCRSVTRYLPDLAVGALQGWSGWRVRRHVEECPSCRAEVARLRAVDARLRRALRAPEPPDDLWASIRREMAPVPVTARQPALRRRVSSAIVGLAATAAVTVALLQPWAPAPTPVAEAPRNEYAVRHVMSGWRDPLADQASLGTLAALMNEGPQGKSP